MLRNKPHESQPTSAAGFQVGVRVQTGTVYPITTATADDEKPTTSSSKPIRLHDLFIGLVRLHILIFTSSSTAVILTHTATHFVNQWRTRYTYTYTLQDVDADKNLFKFHFLTTSTYISDDEVIQGLSKKPIGEGKILLDAGGTDLQEIRCRSKEWIRKRDCGSQARFAYRVYSD
ncbi:hypothetical protein BGZ97_009555 [Linnemannia gamsii]|jgi:hypothetical protein|uniref:Uncharacterized protein n=1 Tax=Linnemannia gamsii TaxID=64522 RepID=A0A9P6RC41_9FUNG|nr:hypothetical protein BGZ97_009555 [Linnemannia gamsii]